MAYLFDGWGRDVLRSLELARAIVRTRGRRCAACGKWLTYDGQRTVRLYCGDTCKRRAARRRERIRAVLAKHHAPCPTCGSRP